MLKLVGRRKCRERCFLLCTSHSPAVQIRTQWTVRSDFRLDAAFFASRRDSKRAPPCPKIQQVLLCVFVGDERGPRYGTKLFRGEKFRALVERHAFGIHVGEPVVLRPAGVGSMEPSIRSMTSPEIEPWGWTPSSFVSEGGHLWAEMMQAMPLADNCRTVKAHS